ncbi:hypothetical protein FO519_006469 [Halicephalobus sp. NKZ332]|nr:hypothetical protein FO519_006469 [Halicephalobus sp. NKZ332]
MNLIFVTVHIKEVFSFLFLISIGFGLGAEIDNRVTGTPIVECEKDFIKVTVPTLKPFKGKIYVKGEYNNNECVNNYASGNFKSSPRKSTVSSKPDNFDDFENSRKSGGRGSTASNKPDDFRNSGRTSGKKGSGDLFVQKKNGGFERVSPEPESRNQNLNSNPRNKNSKSGTESFFKRINENKKKEKLSKTFPDENGECPLVCPPCEDSTKEHREPQGHNFNDNDFVIFKKREKRGADSEANLEVRLGTCNARRDRILNPPGIHVSFTVVVSFHENFITKVDKAYQIACSYEEVDRSVTTQIDVSPPPETNIEAHIEPPRCEYRITSPSGKNTNNVLVGETIQHTWSCSSSNGYNNLNEVYGILVRNCFVEDGKKNKVKIIDEEGCSIYPEIFGTPEYSKDSVSASIKNLVVKFPDQNSVDYQCSIHTCVRAEGHCDGITPPNCGANRHRRHSDPTWPGNATLRGEDWKLHGQRLTVIDIDNNVTEKDFEKLFYSSALISDNIISIDEFCFSVFGFGALVASSTFFFTVAVTVLIGLLCMRNSKSYF